MGTVSGASSLTPTRDVKAHSFRYEHGLAGPDCSLHLLHNRAAEVGDFMMKLPILEEDKPVMQRGPGSSDQAIDQAPFASADYQKVAVCVLPIAALQAIG
jgi:hypothetical protein